MDASARGPTGSSCRGAPPWIKFALGENPKAGNWQSPRPRYPARRGWESSALIREPVPRCAGLPAEAEGGDAGRKRGETVMPVRTDDQLEAVAEILEGKRPSTPTPT